MEALLELLRRHALTHVMLQRLIVKFPQRAAELKELLSVFPRQTTLLIDRTLPLRSVGEVKPLRWLHLSDLHIGHCGLPEWGQRLEPFWRSLKLWVATLGAPDLVLLTGDLTHSGTKVEFDLLAGFLQQLLAALPRLDDGLPPIVVPVPGNHDIQRPRGFAALQFAALDQYDQGDTNPHVRVIREALWRDRDATLIQPLFAQYQAWFDQFIMPQSVRPGVTIHRSFFPGDFWMRLDLPRRFPVGIVGLNSAWRRYRDDGQDGSLTVAVEQLHALLPPGDGAPPLSAFSDVHRSLLVMHHPRNSLSKPSQQDFDGSIGPAGRFSAFLHGHMHRAGAVNKAQDDASIYCYYQAPSLFGHEAWGADQPRPYGYTWGSLSEGGELRIWPLEWARADDGPGTLERDMFFRWEAGSKGVLLHQGDANRWAAGHDLTSMQGGADPPATTPAAPSAGESAAILAYRTWLLQQKPGVDLVGVGGGDMHLELDAVYVPLSLLRTGDDDPAGSPVRADGKPQRLEIESIFGAIRSPHALILGAPGSGKTTALHKLLHRCVREGGASLGLPAGTLPIELRLRRFTPAHKGRPLETWIQEELNERANGQLPPDLGAELWRRGQLLLLADGLDEVADERLRADLCRHLEYQLISARNVRLVVSCRDAGYRREVRFDAQFTQLELSPLGPDQVRTLVRRWFTEAGRVIPTISAAEAQARSESLIRAIESPSNSSQRRLIMVSTPLLLTLLCVIAFQGREMPRNRATYYEECLRVLLLRWGQAKSGQEPPLDYDTAMAVLRSLAYALHESGERDHWFRAKLILHVNHRLRALGNASSSGAAVVEWLHRGAGVLHEYSQEHFGFFHLGIQEFLAASHVAAEGEGRLDDTLGRYLQETWWHEVARLLVALPGRQLCGPLLRRVLRSSNGGYMELVSDLLDDASERDPAPLIERLGEAIPSSDMAVLLRLLHRFAGDPRVVAAALPMLGASDPVVRRLAEQLCDETGGEASGQQIVFLFARGQAKPMSALAGRLAGDGVQVWRDRHGLLLDVFALQGDLDAALAAVCGAILFYGRDRSPATIAALENCLALFADAGKALVCVLLPGGAPPDRAPVGAQVVDNRGGAGYAPLQRWIAEAQRRDLARRINDGKDFTEPGAGMRLLWVPGGRFQRKEQGRANCPVRVSPYWLAETPVTNSQYGEFLKTTGHTEPMFWRDARFAGTDKPVIGVSWEDAMKFCQWLTAQPAMVAAGIHFRLPTEAEWEFANQGLDDRTFPWGNQTPDASRSVFIRGRTIVSVGSCPEGRGPFGHLDLIGNIWEWCFDDAVEKTTPSGRVPELVDPTEASRTTVLRVLRGSSAGRYKDRRMVAAKLGWNPMGQLEARGFRVTAVRMSAPNSFAAVSAPSRG